MRGEVDNIQLKASSLRVKMLGGTNNELGIVSLAAVKYVMEERTPAEGPFEADPREAGVARRVVLRFNDVDKNVMYTYLDADFSQDDDGVQCKVWNPQSKMMEYVGVPMLALKAIFTVKEWDSRSPGPERATSIGERDLWARW